MFLKRLLVLVLLAASVACTQSGGSGGNDRIDGTSDTGGGNGAEGRAYEAYIVRVNQLPAYKSIILPKIEKLLEISPMGKQALPYFEKWLLYKTWHIAPVTLSTISKDVIGISFSNDQTEQLALQTKRSIWINNDRFRRMAIQDQATLILHEMVMSLYYLKYKSWENICFEKIYPDIQCDPSEMDLMNALFPGTEPKPFNSDDYENIRTVTGELLSDRTFKNPQEVDDLLLQNNFDRRFTYNLGMNPNAPKQKIIYRNGLELPVDDLREALQSAKSLNQLPDQCYGVRFKDPIDCDFKFTELTRNWGPYLEYPVIETTTRAYNNGNPFEYVNTISIKDTTVRGSSVEFVQHKRKLFFWLFNPDPYPTPFIIGTMFRNLVLITVQDLTLESPPHTLLGIHSLPGVVTGKHPTYPGECSYAKPTATSIMDDVVIAQSRHLTQFDKAMLASSAGTMPIFTTCRQF